MTAWPEVFKKEDGSAKTIHLTRYTARRKDKKTGEQTIDEPDSQWITIEEINNGALSIKTTSEFRAVVEKKPKLLWLMVARLCALDHSQKVEIDRLANGVRIG